MGNVLIKLEATDERSYVTYTEKHKYDSIKINKRSWPDRLTVLENGYCFYIEFKRVGKAKLAGKRKGEKFQLHTHSKLRLKGFHVYLVDDINHAKAVFQYELANCKKLGKFKPYEGVY